MAGSHLKEITPGQKSPSNFLNHLYFSINPSIYLPYMPLLITKKIRKRVEKSVAKLKNTPSQVHQFIEHSIPTVLPKRGQYTIISSSKPSLNTNYRVQFLSSSSFCIVLVIMYTIFPVLPTSFCHSFCLFMFLCSLCIHYFLLHSNIPLHLCTIICLTIPQSVVT